MVIDIVIPEMIHVDLFRKGDLEQQSQFNVTDIQPESPKAFFDFRVFIVEVAIDVRRVFTGVVVTINPGKDLAEILAVQNKVVFNFIRIWMLVDLRVHISGSLER
jgi:hypothetical protein